jgi:hypothetical protein
MQNPFRYFNSSPEVIRLAVMMYVRYPLSLRQVEDLLFERGIDICHETVRFWRLRSGNGAFIIDHIHAGAGTWMRCSSGSTARSTIYGVRLIMKAKCSRSSRRSTGVARLR